jgi:hypothetical protein
VKRLPTKGDHERFLYVDGGWEPYGNPDHKRFRKTLPDGDVTTTKISRGSQEIGDRNLWSRIIHHQLRVSYEEFFAAVDQGIPPQRDRPIEPDQAEPQSLEAWLVDRLRHQVGLTDEQIAAMTHFEAHEAWTDWQMRPRGS